MDKNHGFTLVEVLVSITILFIIGLAFFQFFINSQKGTVDNQEKLEAYNIAQTVFERVKHGEYRDEINEDITTKETFTYNKCFVGNCDYKYKFKMNDHKYDVRIEVEKFDLDLHLVQVFVTDENMDDESRVKGLINLKTEEVDEP